MINTVTVYNINNKKYIVTSTDDIFYIFEKECSPDLVNVLRDTIADLKEQADYTAQKINTDLDCYESELEEYSSLCSDLKDMINELSDYIDDSKKLDRNHIIKVLSRMKYEINNVN